VAQLKNQTLPPDCPAKLSISEHYALELKNGHPKQKNRRATYPPQSSQNFVRKRLSSLKQLGHTHKNRPTKGIQIGY
jgi:hypothetical protein